MLEDKKSINKHIEEAPAEPLENETPLTDIIVNEEDKKILKPVKEIRRGFTFGYVLTNGTFLREEPDKFGTIVSILKKNDVVTIDSEKKDFYYGSANGRIGYVQKDQIEIR